MFMDKFIEQLDLYFGKKAPQLPRGIKEFLVKIAPYLAIISVALFAISIFPLLTAGFGSLGAVGYYGAGFSRTGLFVHLIVSVIVSVIYLMAIPGLFKRSIRSWNLIFYATLITAIGSLLTFSIARLILGLLIGCYGLFQVRTYYTGQH